MRVVIVGRGKLGRAFARALPIARTLAGRGKKPARIEADIVLLAVPDARIEAVAAELAPRLKQRCAVLHCAGARGLEVLAPLRGAHALGVMHPLVSFASPRDASLAGSTFGTFGDRAAVSAARQLAQMVSARALVLKGAPGPAYHAAAALVANGAVALAAHGAQILRTLDISQRDSERALAGLLASVVENIKSVGVPRALTGPVARGDVTTLERHLAALRALDPALARAYAAVQPLVIDTARAAGLPAKQARALTRQLAK